MFPQVLFFAHGEFPADGSLHWRDDCSDPARLFSLFDVTNEKVVYHHDRSIRGDEVPTPTPIPLTVVNLNRLDSQFPNDRSSVRRLVESLLRDRSLATALGGLFRWYPEGAMRTTTAPLVLSPELKELPVAGRVMKPVDPSRLTRVCPGRMGYRLNAGHLWTHENASYTVISSGGAGRQIVRLGSENEDEDDEEAGGGCGSPVGSFLQRDVDRLRLAYVVAAAANARTNEVSGLRFETGGAGAVESRLQLLVSAPDSQGFNTIGNAT